MKRKIAWLLVSCLVGLSLVLVSCGTTAVEEEEEVTPPTEEEEVVVPEENLSEILSRAQNISTLKYTMVITQPGVPAITSAVWVKKNKMRMEMSVEGTAAISLVDFDTQTMYTYIPTQNIAVKVSVDQASKPATQEVSSIAAYNPKNLGTESIGGIVCYVFEYNSNGDVATMWISKDRGLPIKVEVTTTEGKIISEYKNYEFTDIPDSMFELPSGVQIMQAGQ